MHYTPHNVLACKYWNSNYLKKWNNKKLLHYNKYSFKLSFICYILTLCVSHICVSD